MTQKWKLSSFKSADYTQRTSRFTESWTWTYHWDNETKNRQVSAFFRFSTKCSISTLNKRASFTRIHEYFLKSPPKGKHQRWETPAAETHLSVLCMKAPLTGNMFSQCYLYKNMKRGLRWGPAGLPQRLWGNRFMSLGSVDHQTERHAAASCDARLCLWSVGGQTSETVIVKVEVQMFVPSAHHMFKCFLCFVQQFVFTFH